MYFEHIFKMNIEKRQNWKHFQKLKKKMNSIFLDNLLLLSWKNSLFFEKITTWISSLLSNVNFYLYFIGFIQTKNSQILVQQILNLSNFSPQIFQVELKEQLNYSGESQNHKNNLFHDEKASY